MIAFSISVVDGRFIVQVERLKVADDQSVIGEPLAVSDPFNDWAEAFDWGTNVIFTRAWERPVDVVVN